MFISREQIPTDLIVGDSDPTNSSKMSCRHSSKGCDLFNCSGRTLRDIYNSIDMITREIKLTGSKTVIIFEGINSMTFSRKGLLLYYTEIVRSLKTIGCRVYITTIPKDVEGAGDGLTSRNIDRHNNEIITQVGADGIVPLEEVPMKKGQLHGFLRQTHLFILAQFRNLIDIPGQIYHGFTRSA
ncbi:MAG: hypothetical protein JW774_07385 [Candidatus Aureabacteria bacterium]|nr:hypothetical protein [Candidatus Auribacterota bacterium]